MDPLLTQALQDQLNFERYSAEVYNALACDLDTLNLVGMADYLHKREGEERTHARKFSDYMADRNVRPEMRALEAPPFATPPDALVAGAAAFDAALQHEYIVTDRIDSLYAISEDAGDNATCEFLLWFIHEQVEEVRSLETIMTKFNLVGSDGTGIMLMDKELGS